MDNTFYAYFEEIPTDQLLPILQELDEVERNEGRQARFSLRREEFHGEDCYRVATLPPQGENDTTAYEWGYDTIEERSDELAEAQFRADAAGIEWRAE